MDKGFERNEDQAETRRALIKLLEYVEDECVRVGYAAAGWMVSLSRNTLESDQGQHPTLHFDEFGHPRVN